MTSSFLTWEGGEEWMTGGQRGREGGGREGRRQGEDGGGEGL